MEQWHTMEQWHIHNAWGPDDGLTAGAGPQSARSIAIIGCHRHLTLPDPAEVSSVTESLSRQQMVISGAPRPAPAPAPAPRGTPYLYADDSRRPRDPRLAIPSASGRLHTLQGCCLGTLGCFVDQVWARARARGRCGRGLAWPHAPRASAD
jgi:hypothetical protein